MRALYKTPENDKFHEIVVPNKLNVLQQLVDGYIETVTFAPDACVICNEEGGIFNMPYNCVYAGHLFYGPILIVGIDGDEFTDAPMSILEANKGIDAWGEEDD